MSNVRETPWAEGARRAYSELADALPASLDTEYNDWQERVDSEGSHDIGGFIGSLFVVRATEYETVIDTETVRKISQPIQNEPVRSYLVTADHSYQAMEIVGAYLDQQAPGRHFSFGTNHSVTILKAER